MLAAAAGRFCERVRVILSLRRVSFDDFVYKQAQVATRVLSREAHPALPHAIQERETDNLLVCGVPEQVYYLFKYSNTTAESKNYPKSLGTGIVRVET